MKNETHILYTLATMNRVYERPFSLNILLYDKKHEEEEEKRTPGSRAREQTIVRKQEQDRFE